MSVYHCPLCPLIFQYRTEVEWHLREEHRSRAEEEAELRAELEAAAQPLDEQRLRQLRASKYGPSVTLLLSTAPATTMTVLDIARLRQLAERARRRLPAEPHVDGPVSVIEDRLAKTVAAAESQATDRGLAVLVNPDDLAIVKLPFAPRDRQVVDRGFATRDLDYALQRYPRYRVLVLGHRARILEGHAWQLSDPAMASTGDLDAETLLELRVETAGLLPLVVVGDHRDIDRFQRRSLYAHDVVAAIRRSRFHRTDIVEAVIEGLDRDHREQHSRAVAELLQADTRCSVAWGIHAAWKAVQNRTANQLWVEHDYAVPGRTTPRLHGIEITSDPAEPGAIDDLVDALLTEAATAGIETHLLDRHALDRPEPVAVKIPVPEPVSEGRDHSLVVAA